MKERGMDIGKILLCLEIAAGIALGSLLLGCMAVIGKGNAKMDSYYEIETQMTEFEGSLDDIGRLAEQ